MCDWAADLAASAGPDIVLTCDAGVEAHVCRVGATVRRLLVPGADGSKADVVLGFDDTLPYVDGSSGAYHGATVGRYANRIGGASLTLNGTSYPLPANNGPHCLHGGVRGWDKKPWAAAPAPAPPGGSAVRLQLTSPHGEEGFPGTVAAAVTFSLKGDGTLSIRFQARLVEGGPDEKPGAPPLSTVVSMTQHAYFNLAGHESGPVAGPDAGPSTAHTLRMPGAAFYTPVDASARPLAVPPAPVAGTPFDFLKARNLADAAAELSKARSTLKGESLASNGGFDHNFVLAAPPFGTPDWSAARPLACAGVLRGPAPSNRVLEVWTDAPGVQLYTGNFLGGGDGDGAGEAPGKGGAVYRRHGGVCLETQAFPDSPARPDWAGAVTLTPGGPAYSHVCEWRLGLGEAGMWS